MAKSISGRSTPHRTIIDSVGSIAGFSISMMASASGEKRSQVYAAPAQGSQLQPGRPRSRSSRRFSLLKVAGVLKKEVEQWPGGEGSAPAALQEELRNAHPDAEWAAGEKRNDCVKKAQLDGSTLSSRSDSQNTSGKTWICSASMQMKSSSSYSERKPGRKRS